MMDQKPLMFSTRLHELQNFPNVLRRGDFSRTGVSKWIVKLAFQNLKLRPTEFREPNGFRGISRVRVPDRKHVSDRRQEERFQVGYRADRQIEGRS